MTDSAYADLTAHKAAIDAAITNVTATRGITKTAHGQVERNVAETIWAHINDSDAHNGTAAVAAHEADTTSVHGISDTSVLLTNDLKTSTGSRVLGVKIASGGTVSTLTTATDTAAGRGTAIKTAIEAMVSGDRLWLFPCKAEVSTQITMPDSANGCSIDFGGTYITRTTASVAVLDIGGDHHRISNLFVNGGGDVMVTSSNHGIYDDGYGNYYDNCHVASCSAATDGSCWVLGGDGTVLTGCSGTDPGAACIRFSGPGSFKMVGWISALETERPSYASDAGQFRYFMFGNEVAYKQVAFDGFSFINHTTLWPGAVVDAGIGSIGQVVLANGVIDQGTALSPRDTGQSTPYGQADGNDNSIIKVTGTVESVIISNVTQRHAQTVSTTHSNTCHFVSIDSFETGTSYGELGLIKISGCNIDARPIQIIGPMWLKQLTIEDTICCNERCYMPIGLAPSTSTTQRRHIFRVDCNRVQFMNVLGDTPFFNYSEVTQVTYSSGSGSPLPSVGDQITWDSGASYGLVRELSSGSDATSGVMTVEVFAGTSFGSSGDTITRSGWSATVASISDVTDSVWSFNNCVITHNGKSTSTVGSSQTTNLFKQVHHAGSVIINDVRVSGTNSSSVRLADSSAKRLMASCFDESGTIYYNRHPFDPDSAATIEGEGGATGHSHPALSVAGPGAGEPGTIMPATVVQGFRGQQMVNHNPFLAAEGGDSGAQFDRAVAWRVGTSEGWQIPSV